MGIEVKNRKCIMDDLKKYSPIYKDGDFIEVTEWGNEEGWDIQINDKIFSLSRDELSAIVLLTKYLDRYEE